MKRTSTRCRSCYLSSVPRSELADRFWPKVTIGAADECWPWNAGLDRNGYGHFNGAESSAAHRVAFRLTFGAVPDGLFVLHRCDNPPCVNPAHLFLGTQADNLADMAAKGRSGHRPTKLTPEDAERIRRLAATGLGNQAIGERFGVSRALVRLVVIGERWAA